MSGNPTGGWKYYYPVGNPSNLVGNPSNLVGNPSTVVGSLTAKLPGNPTGGLKYFHQWISYHRGGKSIHPGLNSIQPGWKSIHQTFKNIYVRPSVLFKKKSQNCWFDENLVNSNICFIKGTAAKLWLLKHTFKPLVEGILTT